MLGSEQHSVLPVDVISIDGVGRGLIEVHILIVIEPVSSHLHFLYELPCNQVPHLYLSCLVEGHESVLDYLVGKVFSLLVYPNELYLVSVQQGHYCDVTQGIEVTNSVLHATVEQVVVAAKVDRLEEKGLDLSVVFQALDDILKVVVVQASSISSA